jgi:aminoglycoside phosphotransferase (APT) family kinase protein
LNIPALIMRRLEEALQIHLQTMEPLAGGMWGRTFLIEDGCGKWVARVARNPKSRMRRIPAVQGRARAAGIEAPMVLAHGVEQIDAEDWVWIVEEYIQGDHFLPGELEEDCRRATTADVGRQLRLLHAVEVDGFWRLEADLNSAQYATCRDWIDSQRPNLETATEIFTIDSSHIRQITEVFDEVGSSYSGKGRLCHGDYSSDNLLVRDNRLVAAIDWENAVACDPAYDVAYWYHWDSNEQWLEEFLVGYDSPDGDAFRRRTIAHSVLLSLGFVVWYAVDQSDRQSAEDSLRSLRRNLAVLKRS